jgi:hypothetical protein
MVGLMGGRCSSGWDVVVVVVGGGGEAEWVV